MINISSNENCFQKGRVSVIIPTYNYGHYISYSIESALCQAIEDIEIIVVDDGSTDSTVDIVKKFDDNIRYIIQENKGLSSARNTGINCSTGEFIQFLDSDDILGSNTISKQKAFLERNPDVSISVCDNNLFEICDNNGCPIPNGQWPLYHSSLDVHLCYFNIAPPHAYFFRRDVINKVGWFDTNLKACEDYDFVLRAAMLGYIPYRNPDGMVYYRKHPQSMSKNMANQLKHDAIMHKRLDSHLNNYAAYPKGKRLEAILAFAAGALKTVERLKRVNLGNGDSVLKIAIEKLKEVSDITSKSKTGWNSLSTLFYLRILSTLRNLRLSQSQVIHEIITEINKIACSILGSRSKVKRFTAMLASGLQRKGNYSLESGEIQYYLKRNIIRNIFQNI
jgi:glycosyltransferase involved in cell wall biosynthesis